MPLTTDYTTLHKLMSELETIKPTCSIDVDVKLEKKCYDSIC